MALEHRWSRRRKVCLDALVFHRLPGLIQASVLDISLEGAFIRAEHLVLPPQAGVELTFAMKVDGKQAINHIEALVIHSTRNGHGLMFKDFRLAAFQALKSILYAA
jgi:hypothetical protein